MKQALAIRQLNLDNDGAQHIRAAVLPFLLSTSETLRELPSAHAAVRIYGIEGNASFFRHSGDRSISGC
ncbi:hypothetical protein [Sphingobium sp. BS19]|uniref:hypothetical protein n=1 Tax=Sphingobium sp. BS19 TaxID=3018973 RepID=UPI0024908FB6|nr:hypothetical protein [Sphingobium sp. BS19]